ncbi:MAG: tRNA pseudouridine(55) synthase TruB [Oscillospiraceae bacterium]|nr:tRNA pseudouridine(55) synthase TruB [Oscillospiraceae bacterium]
MNGIICVNKPSGFTSFDVIAKLRGILKFRKLGHAGTLDPLATGVLPIFAGKAAKACNLMPNDDKAYEAGFRLGIETDTLDITGTVKKSISDFNVSAELINDTLPEFTGNISQLPPMYSAVSVGGVKLYKLARKGIEVERVPRPVRVYELSLLSYDGSAEGVLRISCSKGTYVRTIISDIGEKLGCGAVMTSLIRTKACGFTLSDCVTLEELEKNGAEKYIIPIDTLFTELPEIRLHAELEKKYRNGVRTEMRNTKSESGRYRVYGADGMFIGIAAMVNNELRVEKNLC